MANLKVKLEGKKIAEKVMEFMDNYSFGPVYEGIKEYGEAIAKAAREQYYR